MIYFIQSSWLHAFQSGIVILTGYALALALAIPYLFSLCQFRSSIVRFFSLSSLSEWIHVGRERNTLVYTLKYFGVVCFFCLCSVLHFYCIIIIGAVEITTGIAIQNQTTTATITKNKILKHRIALCKHMKTSTKSKW